MVVAVAVIDVIAHGVHHLMAAHAEPQDARLASERDRARGLGEVG
ncbi:MAG TPA: hypothetical protein VHV74_07820 [Pseudonocardiaceae bacterium]|nr:hypothetical protein [Pseudonocardiaceae bacterium]